MFRRLATRLSALLAAAVATIALSLALPLAADASWCFDDPPITINGQTFRVEVGVQADMATTQANILMANIVIRVPQGVTNVTVGAVPQTPFPEHVTVVANNGSYQKGHGMHVQVVTTFTVKAGTPALNANTVLTAANGTSATATAAVQGSLSRDIQLPL